MSVCTDILRVLEAAKANNLTLEEVLLRVKKEAKREAEGSCNILA